jgi:hypothetical protein
MLAAFLPTLLAMAVLTVEVGTGRKLYLMDWYIAVALVALSLARQVLMLVEQVGPGSPFRRAATEEASGA